MPSVTALPVARYKGSVGCLYVRLWMTTVATMQIAVSNSTSPTTDQPSFVRAGTYRGTWGGGEECAMAENIDTPHQPSESRGVSNQGW